MWSDEKFEEYEKQLGDELDGETPDDFSEYLYECARRIRAEKDAQAPTPRP